MIYLGTIVILIQRHNHSDHNVSNANYKTLLHIITCLLDKAKSALLIKKIQLTCYFMQVCQQVYIYMCVLSICYSLCCDQYDASILVYLYIYIMIRKTF